MMQEKEEKEHFFLWFSDLDFCKIAWFQQRFSMLLIVKAQVPTNG
jgi:hypothetical protein